MRIHIFLVVFLFLFIKTNAQQSQGSLTEQFANQTGVLISKQYVELGFMDLIDFRLVKMKNNFTNDTAFGVRLEYLPGNELISSVKVAYIDDDEIDGLIRAIDIFQSSILNYRYAYAADFTFRCRSGLVVGYYYEAEKAKWDPFIQIQYKDPQSTIRVENDNFDYLKKLLKDAKSKR